MNLMKSYPCQHKNTYLQYVSLYSSVMINQLICHVNANDPVNTDHNKPVFAVDFKLLPVKLQSIIYKQLLPCANCVHIFKNLFFSCPYASWKTVF